MKKTIRRSVQIRQKYEKGMANLHGWAERRLRKLKREEALKKLLSR